MDRKKKKMNRTVGFSRCWTLHTDRQKDRNEYRLTESSVERSTKRKIEERKNFDENLMKI